MENSLNQPRIIDKQIEKYLKACGAVCLEGIRGCGKTHTASQWCSSVIDISDPSGNFQNRRLAEMSSGLILEGEKPLLIDEWQQCPALWDTVRNYVDRHPGKGQVILCNSYTPEHKEILHSGAGRIGRLRNRPMSLYESGHSSGVISLQELCHHSFAASMTESASLKEFAEWIVRGGWPFAQQVSVKQASLEVSKLLDQILETDADLAAGVKRDHEKMRLLLKALARNTSLTITNKALQDDVKAADGIDIDVDSIAAYLKVFDQLFLTDNQKPFPVLVRQAVKRRKAEKRHLADPSLTCVLLELTPEKLIWNLDLFERLFESMVIRDLKVYGQSFNAEVYHYQDYAGKKIDAAILLDDGCWAAFEIRLGANQIEDAAVHLVSLKRLIQKDKKGNPPDVLCVICGLSNAAYQRSDGVYVIPVTALKP